MKLDGLALDESFYGVAGVNHANTNLFVSADSNPDNEAEFRSLGVRYGVPTASVRSAPEVFRERARLEERKKASESPAMQAWLGQSPDNAALASDTDLRVMGRMEKTIRDLAEGFGGQFVGSGLTGIGHALDAVQRRVVEGAARLVLPKPMAGGEVDPSSLTGAPMGEGFRALGEPAKAYWKAQGVPDARKDFVDHVVSGIGQIVGQVPLAATPAGWPMLFGQGVDQLADKVAKDDAPQWKKDLAMLGGGAVTAVTEKWALDHWAKLAPLTAIKNPLLARAAGVSIATASEGGQEFTENVLQDALRQQLTNPNAQIDLGDAAYSGGVGATVGGLARAVLESALHIKGRHQQQFFTDLGDAAKVSELAQRAPDKLSEFIAHAAKGTPVENVFIPAEQFTRYFQSVGADPAQAAELVGAKNYAEAGAAGTDVVISLADFTAKVAPTEHLTGLMPDLRMHQGDLTARELSEMQGNEQAREEYFRQQLDSLIAENEATNGVNTAIERVTNDMEGQLRASGVESSTAKTQAQLMRGVAVLAQRAYPDLNPVDAAERLWDKYGLTVQRDLPPILTTLKNADVQLDPLLDRLRAGALPSEQETFGQPLHEFLRALGGVQDQGGELSARDADADNAPFVKNIIQQMGMDFDGARELAAQHGFPVGESEADFISALVGSLEGNPIYSPEQENAGNIDTLHTLESLDRALKDSGIDLNAVDNATARKMLERAGEVSGARFNQSLMAPEERRDALVAMPVINLDDKTLDGLEGAELREAAAERFKALKGHPARTSDGRTVQFTGVGLREIKQHSADRKVLDLMAKAGDVIPEAIPLFSVDHERSGPQDAIRAWHYYGAKVSIRGAEYFAKIVVRESVNGEIYYDNDLTSVEEASGRIGDATPTKSEAATVSADQHTLVDWFESVKTGSTLYQSQLDKKRGFLEIGANGQMRIGLTENANLSTFLHETGHFYLEMMGDLASDEAASQQVKEDYATILQWFGVADRSQIETKHHEQFARGNEAYLMEGKAPAPELQGAFQRVKAWLTHIYRSLTALDVKLSDDVRGVFDRIYATDQEIEAAGDAVDVAPLFVDAATMGMSEAEFALYKDFVGKVSLEAQEKLTAKLMREYQRGQQAWWKEERSKVREEVVAEVDAQPVYRVFAALAVGEMNGDPFKLSRDDLVRRYGETYLKNLPRGFQRVYAAEGGIDLDTAAEMAGFSSGDDLVKALVDMRKRSELIEAETDQRMSERHGDMMLDGTMADAAKAALHNDRRADVLAIELRALKKKAREVAPFVKAEQDKAKAEQAGRVAAAEVPPPAVFRRAAEGIIDQMQTKDVQPNAYLIAGRRAGKEAFAALAKNDPMTAAAAKQREVLNHYLYLEAVKAREEATSIVKHARTFEKQSKRERIGKAGADYLGQIDALLERYELANVTLNAISRRAALREFIAAQEAAGGIVTIDEALQDESRRVNWRQAPMFELRALHDALRNLEHLAVFKNKLIRKRAAIDFAKVRDELLASIESNFEDSSTGELGKLNDKGDGLRAKIIANMRKFDAGLIKIEQEIAWMDGGNIDGPWARYVFDLAADAQTMEYDLHAAATAKIQALHESMPKAWGHSLSDKTGVRLPGIGQVLTRYDLLSIAMNTGNQSNYDKLLKGRGWTDAQVQDALSRLTDEDWTYVQGVWDTLESLWPEIVAVQKRMAGVEPEKVEARKIITASGREFAGGYFPLVYDPALSRAGEKQDDASESVQDFMARGYGRASTDKGHTKGRLEDFAAPIRLDFEQVLTSHLSKVIKDISHREPILSLNKILNDSRIKAAIIDKRGMDKYQLLTTWEQSLISDRADTLHRPLAWYNALARGLRTNTAIVTMGWKISTAFSQIAGVASAMDTVKPSYLAPALRDFLRSPQATVDMVAEKSGEMRHRAGTIERDVKEQLLKTRGAHGIKAAVQRSAFYLTAMADRVVSVPTWLGGYRQALATGAVEEDAVRAGDRAVRLSQGAGGAKDLAAVQRNSEMMKLLTMYYTPFSVLYARLRDMGHSYKAPQDLPRLAARSLALVILPAVLGELLAGRGPDDDEDKTLWAMRKAMLYPFASVPVIRDLANWKLEPALAELSGGSIRYQPGYKFTPIISAVEKIVAMPDRLIDGWTGARPWDDVAWDELEMAGYLFGLPTAQPRITGEYLADLFSGNANPASASEALHDVLFRRPPERR